MNAPPAARGGAPPLADRLSRLALGAGLALLPFAPALGATPVAGVACVTDRRATQVERPVGRDWPAPLDRVVLAAFDDVPLRVALERLADSAKVRLSYSPELLPVERRVCLPAARMPLGDALAHLLDGVGISPVIAGSDQVVLAPARTAAGADAAPDAARPARRLERVVITGTAAGGPERSSPFGITVIDGEALAREGTRPLSQMLDALVPGVWLWSQSPTTPLSRYGSVRGASSFGVSAPKIYLDGVEVANPLLLTQIDPSQVQRVEVIRGPQGAALYGADAISGVVQIVTRHDGVSARTPAVGARASAGTSASAFDTDGGGVLAQDHGVVLRAGTAARSASLSAAYSTIGAFVPGAEARQLLVNGGARHVGTKLVTTGTLRFDDAVSQAAASPLLSAGDSVGRQSVRQYTLGGSATMHASERWTHVATMGLDGYRLSGLSSAGMPILSATDSALNAARGGADRASLRLSSTARFGTTESRSFDLTLGAEHSSARERTRGTVPHIASRDVDRAVVMTPPDSATSEIATTWWHNTGLLAQGQLGFAGRAFLTGGARLERLAGAVEEPSMALLPMLGASWVAERGAASLKLRAAYGRGIRQARTVARGATWMAARAPSDFADLSLDPEEQAGTEVGADFGWGDSKDGRGTALRLEITRFDQQARGLVQPVAIVVHDAPTYPEYGGSGPGPGGSSGPGGGTSGGNSGSRMSHERVAYRLQNVGAIDNSGWELGASATRGALSLGASAAFVDSRVARLATGYRGDLRAGDRMLEVPARTLGLDATWNSARWSLSATATRAWDWVNYDRVALSAAYAASAADTTGATLPPAGVQLRQYWRTYQGVTRLGAHGAFALNGRASLTISGENLLDRQVGEPDNATVLPGRTITLGLRTGF